MNIQQQITLRSNGSKRHHSIGEIVMDDSSDIYEKNHRNVLFPQSRESQETFSSLDESNCESKKEIQVNFSIDNNNRKDSQISSKNYQIVKKNGMDVIQNSGMSSTDSSCDDKTKNRRKGTKNSQESIQSYDSTNEYKRQYNHPVFPFKERNQGKLFANPDACQQYFMKYSKRNELSKKKNNSMLNIMEGCSNSSKGNTPKSRSSSKMSSHRKTPASKLLMMQPATTRNNRNNLFQSGSKKHNKTTRVKSKNAAQLKKQTDSSSRNISNKQ